MSLFPTDDAGRKMLPVFKMITRYFPKALREVTRVCVANNVRYNPERDPADINWARGKSPDQLGSAFRHMLESEVDGKVFEEAANGERLYVLAEGAWRMLAALELEIERQEAKVPTGTPPVELPTVPAVSSPGDLGHRAKCLMANCDERRHPGTFFCPKHDLE